MKKQFAILLTAILLSLPAFATIIHVPGDYPTIQQAVNNANDGDSILVDPGIYEGIRVVYSPNDITLIGSGAFCDNPTTITSYINPDTSSCISLNYVSGWKLQDLLLIGTESATSFNGAFDILFCSNISVET